MPPPPPSSSSLVPAGARTEFDILRASHQFLRDDADDDTTTSWDDAVARKYYAALWKEYAVCDLKHYKSGNFALRWRTEAEVVSGAGERSCGNTRCALHAPLAPADAADAEPRAPGLSTLELPFAYAEHGARKEALVKVVLCARCVRRLMWTREQAKAAAAAAAAAAGPAPGPGPGVKEEDDDDDIGDARSREDSRASEEQERRRRRHRRSRSPGAEPIAPPRRHRPRRSRSRSPGADHDNPSRRRRSSRSRSPAPRRDGHRARRA